MSYVSPDHAAQKILNQQDTSWSENNVSICTLCIHSFFASREENSSLIPLTTSRFWRLNTNNLQLKNTSVNTNLNRMRYIASPQSIFSAFPFLFPFILIILLRRCWSWLFFVKVSSWKMLARSSWGKNRGTAAHIGCRCVKWWLWEAMVIKEHMVHNKSVQ